MKKGLRQLTACVLAVMLIIPCFTVVAAAPFSLPDLISDNMLVQRDMPIKLWGYGGTPGDTLTVEIEDEKGVALSEGTTTIGDSGFNIELPAMEAGGPYTITFFNDKGTKLAIVHNVLVGELWFQGGQSNMQLKIESIPENIDERVNPEPKDDTIRLFYNRDHFTADEPATDLEGKWIIADKGLKEYSAVGYKALEIMNNELGVPVGGICSPYGGSSIISHIAPDGKIFKAKIAPVTNFNIRGVMWYQGESDRDNGIESIEKEYNQLISSLRQEWNNENLPFVIVQLHPSPMKDLVYGSKTEYEVKDFSDARVAIGNTYASNENVGMAVAYDLSTTKYRAIGEDSNHPYIKAPIGERLGNVALSMVYGKDIDANSPLYMSKSVNGNELTLKFTDTYDGLKTTDDSEPEGFMIAGEDGIYYEANAVLLGDTVILTSDKVASPVNASYGLEKHYFPYPGAPKDQASIDAVPDICELTMNVVNSANLPVAAFDTAVSIGKSAEAFTDEEQIPSAPIKVDEIENIGNKTVLYVATDGKDTNNGSIDKPFASIEKARDTIRALKLDGKLGDNGAVVYIREGSYYRINGINFTEEDSGTEDAPIIYRNYPDEKVIFIGGAGIESEAFSKVKDKKILEKIADEKARDKIVEADMFALGYTSLPEQTWPGAYSYFGGMPEIHGKTKPEAVAAELIVDDKVMTLARYPNEGYMYIKSVIEPGEHVRMWDDDKASDPNYIPPEKRKTTPFTITVDDNRVKHWGNAKDALLSGCFMFSWADQTVPLASVDTSKNALTSKYPSVYQAAANQYFYIYNLIEEIDIPGEYFVDRDKGKLYLYPPESGLGNIIYTSLDEYMFTANEAEYITIKGIDMSYMRSGAVKFENTYECELIDCEITNTGNTAVMVSGSGNRVYDCYISNVNMGILVEGGDDETLTHSDNVIENNEIESADKISKTYSYAIQAKGTGIYVLNNELHEADHALLGFSGSENTIAYNELYNACLHADDMGAIYTGRKLTHKGNQILHNYIHDIGDVQAGGIGVQGLFLDDWWSSALIEGNVFENIQGQGVKFAGSYNKLNNNMFINITKEAAALNRSYAYGGADSEYAYREDIASKPYIYGELWLSKYPEMANVIDKDDRLDMNNYITATNNILFNSGDILASAEILRTATIENNKKYVSDPGFRNLDEKNYLLNPDSKVYEDIPGFKPILFSRMGRYSDRALERVRKANVWCMDSPYIMQDGEKHKEEKISAKAIDGKFYVSLRSGANGIGGTVSFNEATNDILVSTGVKTLSFRDGETGSVILNGSEQTLINPIVNIDYTNYISVEDLAVLFEKSLVQKGNLAVISDIKDLFTDVIDDSLLRYIEEQLTMY